MSLSISGTVSAPPATDTPAPASAAIQPAPQSIQSSVDTVVLSLSAKVSQLYLQGQSPTQIAENLGIPQSTVDSDLRTLAAILVSAPAAATTAAKSAPAA